MHRKIIRTWVDLEFLLYLGQPMKLVLMQTKRSKLPSGTCPQKPKFAKPYIFLTAKSGEDKMSKALELVGLALIGIMFAAFVGFIPGVENGLSPVFWACAVGALAIIFYRKRKKKQEETQT